MTRIPLALFPLGFARKLKFLRELGKTVLVYFPIQNDIRAAQLPNYDEPESYVIQFLFSSFVWAVLLYSAVVVMLYIVQLQTTEEALVSALPYGIGFFFLFAAIHFYYPKIISSKIAEEANKQLIFVLRDMWVQSTSGVPLYSILQNIATANYGVISFDIRGAVRAISAGEREVVVLEKISATTKSENFKKALWHITASMRTGIGLTPALKATLDVLTTEQHRVVREYGSTLNFILLLYLLFAAVIPSILTTFFSILSVFGVFILSPTFLYVVVIVSAVIQLSLVGYIRASRPIV